MRPLQVSFDDVTVKPYGRVAVHPHRAGTCSTHPVTGQATDALSAVVRSLGQHLTREFGVPVVDVVADFVRDTASRLVLLQARATAPVQLRRVLSRCCTRCLQIKGYKFKEGAVLKHIPVPRSSLLAAGADSAAASALLPFAISQHDAQQRTVLSVPPSCDCGLIPAGLACVQCKRWWACSRQTCPRRPQWALALTRWRWMRSRCPPCPRRA